MKDDLKQYILTGRYDLAKKVCDNIHTNDIEKTITDIAYDTESISIYSFSQYMALTTEKKEWIEIAIDIMLHPLCHIEGAYSAALFLVRKLLEIERNAENLELMLFLHHIPDEVVSREEAIDIVDEVLELNPNSKIALEIKEKYCN